MPPWWDADLAWWAAIVAGAGNIAHMLGQALAQWAASRRPGVPEAERFLARAWLATIGGVATWAGGLVAAVTWVTFMLEGRAGVLRWGLLAGVFGINAGLLAARWLRHRSDQANPRRGRRPPG